MNRPLYQNGMWHVLFELSVAEGATAWAETDPILDSWHAQHRR